MRESETAFVDDVEVGGKEENDENPEEDTLMLTWLYERIDVALLDGVQKNEVDCFGQKPAPDRRDFQTS